MKTPANHTNDWRIDDVIDFEFFLAADKALTDAEVIARDRPVYSGKIHGLLESAVPSNQRFKIHLWLQARREASRSAGEELPGRLFHEAYHFMLGLLCAAGLIFGALVATSHLYYFGGQPINVLVFLTVTVLPQILLLAFVAVSLLSRNALRSYEGIGLLRWILRTVFLQLVAAREKALHHAGGERRLHFAAVWGIIQARRSTYGSLWLWPLLVLTQAFAVCFNVGAIVMILLMVAISNRAFGWETTLNLGPGAMFHFINTVALPWSWLVPYAHPTLDQIIGSRIALHGQGIYPVDALISWWPFLCYAVCFYGLLPRAILLAMARSKERRTLAALPFNSSECNRLVRLMEPLVVAGPPGPKLETGQPGGTSAAHAGANSCAVIVSRELALSETALAQCLGRSGWEPQSFTVAEIDLPEANSALFETLALTGSPGSQPQIVVAVDASRPPIKAILLFLKKLRSACGDAAAITIFLVAAGDAAEDYSAIWKQTVAALRDPHLGVECGSLP